MLLRMVVTWATLIALFNVVSFTCVNAEMTNFYELYDTAGPADAQFVVPVGVFSLTLHMEGGSFNPLGLSATEGYAASATINVLPNDIINIHVGDAHAECGAEASYASKADDDSFLLLVAGSNLENGNAFASWSTASEFSGEGLLDGILTCGGLSYYSGSTLGVAARSATGAAYVNITWEQECTEDFDVLLSDYNPILLSTSSLYIRDNKPVLALDVGLPVYYYDQVFSFKGANCDDLRPNVSVETVGCHNYFFTSVLDYADRCDFELTDSDDNSGQLYRGTFEVNSTVDVPTNDFGVIPRYESRPINWQVYVPNTITVESDVIVMRGMCSNYTDCNGFCCGLDGLCDCNCTASPFNIANNVTGYVGDRCEIDTNPPFVINVDVDPDQTVIEETIAVVSPRGGCVTGVFTQKPYITNNAHEITTFRRTFEGHGTIDLLDPDVHDNLLDLCFAPGLHISPDGAFAEYADTLFGDDATRRRLLDLNNGIFEQVSDPFGLYVFVYFAEDAAGNTVTYKFNVEVAERNGPHVDCANCQEEFQNDGTDLHYHCHGTNDTENPFELIVIDHHEFVSRMATHNSGGRFLDQHPGSLIDMTTNLGYDNLYINGTLYPQFQSAYINCNCKIDLTIVDLAVGHAEVTNSWFSWSVPIGVDVTDSNPIVKITEGGEFGTAPPYDGDWMVTYTATDAQNNTGKCSKKITYDATPPVCDGWFHTVYVDPANPGWSPPVDWPEIPPGLVDETSGIENITLYPPREQQFTYQIGNLATFNVSSTYIVKDAAGNVGVCPWFLHIINVDQCEGPDCGNNSPYDLMCPFTVSHECDHLKTLAGGIVSWKEPFFSDDHAVVRLEQSHYSGDYFPVGITFVNYTAWDEEGRTAVCDFEIIIYDITPPIITGCPSDSTLYTGNSSSVKYSYAFSANDTCGDASNMRFETTTFPTQAELGSDGYPNGTEILSPGTHYFMYKIYDASENMQLCAWEVTVEDDWAPVVRCNEDVVTRLQSPSIDSITVTYEYRQLIENYMAIVAYDFNPGSNFFYGVTTVTALAIDLAGNTGACQFDVIVQDAYPFPDVDAVLTKAVIKETDNPGEFAAKLNFITVTPEYHRILNAQSISDAAINDPVELNADCRTPDGYFGPYDDCYQEWSVTVILDGCEITNEQHTFRMFDFCTPDDCVRTAETGDPFDVTITLTAANYCWQDLSMVTLTATLSTHSPEVGAQFEADVEAAEPGTLSIADYDVKQVFNGEIDYVYGVVEVECEQAFLTDVRLLSVYREFYTDETYTEVYESTLVHRSDFVIDGVPQTDFYIQMLTPPEAVPVLWQSPYAASFNYIEQGRAQRPYLMYTATVEVTYDSGLRRRLMQFSATGGDGFSQDTAAVLMLDSSDSFVQFDDTTGVLILKLSECETLTTSHVEMLAEPVATHLAISPSRVSLKLMNTTECLVELTLKGPECDGEYHVDTLMYRMCNDSIPDTSSDLHTRVSSVLTEAQSFQSEVCYYSRTPSVYVNDLADCFHIEANDFILGFVQSEFMLYVAIMIALFVLVCFYGMCYYWKKNRDDKPQDSLHSPPSTLEIDSQFTGVVSNKTPRHHSVGCTLKVKTRLTPRNVRKSSQELDWRDMNDLLSNIEAADHDQHVLVHVE